MGKTREDYVTELAEKRSVLEHIASFSEVEAMKVWTDEDLVFFTAANQRYGEVEDILQFIDDQFPPPESEPIETIDLLRRVARHLCGKIVTVVIEKPTTPGAVGEAIGTHISISPRVVFLQMSILQHSCMNARTSYCIKARPENPWGKRRPKQTG